LIGIDPRLHANRYHCLLQKPGTMLLIGLWRTTGLSGLLLLPLQIDASSNRSKVPFTFAI